MLLKRLHVHVRLNNKTCAVVFEGALQLKFSLRIIFCIQLIPGCCSQQCSTKWESMAYTCIVACPGIFTV